MLSAASSPTSHRHLLLRWALGFFFCNALFFCCLQLLNLATVSLPSLQQYYLPQVVMIWLYLISATVGFISLLMIVPGLLLTLPVIIVIPRRFVVFIWSSLIATGLIALFLADIYTYRQYRFHLNGVIWQMLFSPARNEIFAASMAETITIVTAMLGIFLAQLVLAHLIWRHVNKHAYYRHSGTITTLILGCFCLSYLLFLTANSVIIYDQKTMAGYNALSLKARAFPGFINSIVAILPAKYGLDAFAKRGSGFVAQPPPNAQAPHYPLHPLHCSVPQKPLNVLLIVIDTWRFDVVKTQLMPHIARFATQATQYTDHISGGNCTRPGMFSLFYGLPATYWGDMLRHQTRPVLLQALADADYQFAIFASAELDMPEFNQTLFAGIPQLRIKTPGEYPYQRDAHITADMQQFLKQSHQRPFFGFLFYDAVHSNCAPFDYPTPFTPYVKACNRLLLSAQSDPMPYFNRYKNALRYVDGLVGKVLATLKQQHLLDSTVVILTGDHGQEYNDNHNNFWGHASNFSRYQIGTPLIVHWPFQAPQHITQRTSHFDVAPTLLHRLLGCQNQTTDYSVGHLLSAPQKPPFYLLGSYVGYGVLTQDHVISLLPTGNYRIEDLQANPMPHATLNMALMAKVFAMMQRFHQHA